MSRLLISLCLSLLFSTVQAQLSIPEFQKGKAILSGTISNYNPNDDLNFRIGVPNILMKIVNLSSPPSKQMEVSK